jgi:hypothetical protein
MPKHIFFAATLQLRQQSCRCTRSPGKVWTTVDFIPAVSSVELCVRLQYAQYPAMEQRYEPQEMANDRQCKYSGLAHTALACMRPDFARKILPAEAELCAEMLNAP